MKRTLLLLAALSGCATTLPLRPCKDPLQNVTLTAPGWAYNEPGNRATVAVTIHNPEPHMVEVEMGCGSEGGQLYQHRVRVGSFMEQVVLFSVDRQVYRMGTFTCQITGVEPYASE